MDSFLEQNFKSINLWACLEIFFRGEDKQSHENRREVFQQRIRKSSGGRISAFSIRYPGKHARAPSLRVLKIVLNIVISTSSFSTLEIWRFPKKTADKGWSASSREIWRKCAWGDLIWNLMGAKKIIQPTKSDKVANLPKRRLLECIAGTAGTAAPALRTRRPWEKSTARGVHRFSTSRMPQIVCPLRRNAKRHHPGLYVGILAFYLKDGGSRTKYSFGQLLGHKFS